MARVNLANRVEGSWNGHWPPELGEKVRVWTPKDLRGKKVMVVADEYEVKKGYKPATSGKVRCKAKDEDGEWFTFLAGPRQVLPGDVKIKDIEQAE